MMTMHLAVLICFCIYGTNAVKHYGMIPSVDMHNTVQEHAKKFLENDMELVSVFMTNNHHVHNGSDFLSEIGEYNKTVNDIFASSIHSFGESVIRARNPVNGKCEGHGNIHDNLSDDQINLICGSLAGGAGQAVSTIIEVVESKVCTEAGTGHPLPSCKTIIGFIRGTGQGFTTIEVNQYCPAFLSFFVGCKGNNAKAHAEDNKIEMTAFNSQKDYDCDNANKGQNRCVETTVG